jgi:hypothetical protein
MSNYTTQRSGNWSDSTSSSPWYTGTIPAPIPGAGDTIVIDSGHTITIPDGYNAVVGNSPASAGVVLTVSGTGALVVGGGSSGSLQVLGSVLFSDTANALTVNAGGTLFLDGSGNVGQRYTLGVGGLTRVRFNGTSSAHVTVKSTIAGGATPGVVLSGNGNYTGGVLASYTDFQYLGDSATRAWQTMMNQNYGGTPSLDWLFVFDHCTFDHCGEFSGGSANACSGSRFEVTNCTTTNSLTDGSTSFIFSLGLNEAPPTSGGTYLFTGNTFDAAPRFVASGGLTCTGNYFGQGFNSIVSDTGTWAVFSGNFIRDAGTSDANGDLIHGDISECYYFADSAITDNWHATSLTAAA